MRPLADRMVHAGMAVEMPLLPGHGTAVEDMIPTRFADWSSAADEAYQRLAARTESVVVVGLSMGGTLTCWLAEQHPEIAGIVVINPLVQPVGPEMSEGLTSLLESGLETLDAIGSDIAKEGADERSYPATPIAAALSLFKGVEEVSAALGTITCPALLFSSRVDHVVDPSNGEHLVASIGGSIEQIYLDRSFHVATLDHDAALIEDQAVAFVERLAAS